MKAIINDKLYDTDKAEVVFSLKREVADMEVFWKPGRHLAKWHRIDIYVTKKGNYFECDQDDQQIKSITQMEAKKTIKDLNPDEYIKIFGEVEEA